jgi:hypothetical protein
MLNQSANNSMNYNKIHKIWEKIKTPALLQTYQTRKIFQTNT